MDSVNAPDPTAVREAAVLVAERFQKATVTPADWLGLLRESEMFAGFILAFTDPTPLTVEVLVRMGFVLKSANLETWKRGTLIASKQDDGFAFATESMSYVWPAPRTAGELAMLLAMMEGR